MNKKRIWSTILLTLLINILCVPLWTECDYVGFVRTFFNEEARLDLLYRGKITGAEPFSFQSTPKPLLYSWSYEAKRNTRRVPLVMRAKGSWQKLSLQIEALQDGEITVFLRGPEKQDEYGSHHSILVDWADFKINGKVIFNRSRSLSHRKPFTKQIPVKKNEALHIEAEFRRHHFTTHDFTWLSSGNLWYLITGNLLTIFLIYRLLSYFAEHREHLRLGDTLLVVIFFPCLFIPMMNISGEVKSDRESRMLAVRPKLGEILKGGINTGGGGYEKYFSDHFGGRVVLSKLHDIIRNKMSKIIRSQGAVYFKEGGWAFLTPFVQDWDYRSVVSQSIVYNLVQLHQFCQQHKIKLYVLEVPRRESVYKEIIENKYGFDKKQFIKVSQAHETIRKEVREHHIPYVYLYKELCNAASHDFVFYKWKHHWTDWGAFVGYRELMKEINKDFPDMPVVSLNDYCKVSSWLIRDEYERKYNLGRHLYQFFNNERSDDPPNRALYNYYDHKNADKMTIKVGENQKEFSYPDGKHKVMLIGTSQNESLLQFLPYSTASTKYIRLNIGEIKEKERYKVLKLYKKDILAFKPEILILSISEINLYRLQDLCSTK